MTLARIENGFINQSRTGSNHRPGDAQLLEMRLAFRRNKLAAQLRSRKLLLLDQQHAHTAARQVNRSTGARWSTTRDDHVEVVAMWFEHVKPAGKENVDLPKHPAAPLASPGRIILPL